MCSQGILTKYPNPPKRALFDEEEHMYRISRSSQGAESCRLGRPSSLGSFLWVLWSCWDLQHVCCQGWRKTEIMISTSQFEIIIPNWRKTDFHLWVGNESLPQVEWLCTCPNWILCPQPGGVSWRLHGQGAPGSLQGVRPSQFNLTIHLGLPGLFGSLPHHQIQFTMRWRSVDISTPLFIQPSVQDIQPQVQWHLIQFSLFI